MKKNEKSTLKNLLFEKGNEYKNLFAETKFSFQKLWHCPKPGKRHAMLRTNSCQHVDNRFEQLLIHFLLF